MGSEQNQLSDPLHSIRSIRVPEKLTGYYDGWSETYDQFVHGIRYNGPTLAAQTIAEFYPDERETISILDIGAGTGLMGSELQKLGFRIIDGLDPSPGMLEKAKLSKAYRNLFCRYFNSGPTDGLQKGSYDVIASCGSLMPGHLPFDCFIEATRLGKGGGIIAMVARTEGEGNVLLPEYYGGLMGTITKLENEGALEKLKWEQCHYENNINGLILVFRVK